MEYMSIIMFGFGMIILLSGHMTKENHFLVIGHVWLVGSVLMSSIKQISTIAG